MQPRSNLIGRPPDTPMNCDSPDYLAQMIAAHKQGRAIGITSICSANRYVLDACVRRAASDGSVLLIESTCNQVNQYGGYTGLTPAQFRDHVMRLARAWGLSADRLILGGDHLGPNPWTHETAPRAMARARQLVHDYVAAGYQKIHLDASMRCADDDPSFPLSAEISADRTAALCQAAEEAVAASPPGTNAPRYVIGTEVPAPGGTVGKDDEPPVTRVNDARETLELTRRAFMARGLDGAWERVMGLVVQPGVDFGVDTIRPYRPRVAAALSEFIEEYEHIVFEAHSTDYQTKNALANLVRDHFAILKVGPALTFAFREAVFALAMMEETWLGSNRAIKRSDLISLVDREMIERPGDWEAYYQGAEAYVKFARGYGYSDRVRYYWPSPVLQEAIRLLIDNLERYPPPLSLVSQFMPGQYARIRVGELVNRPKDLIRSKIELVLEDYKYAVEGGEAQIAVGQRPPDESR